MPGEENRNHVISVAMPLWLPAEHTGLLVPYRKQKHKNHEISVAMPAVAAAEHTGLLAPFRDEQANEEQPPGQRRLTLAQRSCGCLCTTG